MATSSIPGLIAVRSGAVFRDARQGDAAFLRPVVGGDDSSLQLTRDAVTGEDRSFTITAEQAILHNSWGRSPARRTPQGPGVETHQRLAHLGRHYLLTWLPSPYLWRWQRDVHPFSEGLWPRLTKVEID